MKDTIILLFGIGLFLSGILMNVIQDQLDESRREYAACAQELSHARSSLIVCQAVPSESTVEASR